MDNEIERDVVDKPESKSQVQAQSSPKSKGQICTLGCHKYYIIWVNKLAMKVQGLFISTAGLVLTISF